MKRILLFTALLFIGVTTQAQRLMNSSRSTVGYIESGRVMNSSRSTIGYIEDGRIMNSSRSTIGYIENGRVMNSSRSTIGYIEDGRVMNSSRSTIGYVEDGRAMNSSRSTIGYFESLKPTHAALYFFFFFDWFQQRFVTMVPKKIMFNEVWLVNFHNRVLLRINQVICYYVKQTPQNQFFLFRHRPNATGLHHRQTRANWRQAEIG